MRYLDPILMSQTVEEMVGVINGNFVRVESSIEPGSGGGGTVVESIRFDFPVPLEIWTCAHNKNSSKVTGSPYDLTGEQLIANKQFSVDNNTYECRFAIPQAGYAVLRF